MRPGARHRITKTLQKLFWIYLTNNFVITSPSELTVTQPSGECILLPITQANCSRVSEFRDEDRVSEYSAKIAHGEIGFFCERNGKAVGSIWASINGTGVQQIVRMYMPLMPQDALIHDIVTGERCRGMGIGPFMLARIASILFSEYAVNRIIVDVNARNVPSLRMMEKAGLQMKQRVLYISAFGTLAWERVVKRYV